MERMPFAYVAIAVVIWLAAVAAWFAAFRHFRERPTQLSTKDKILGFMLAGPFFGSLHSSLSPRGYRLTKRETVGLLFIITVVVTIILGSLIHAYSAT